MWSALIQCSVLNTICANHSTQIILKSFCSQLVCLVTAAILALCKSSHLLSFQCRTSEHKSPSSNCYQVMVKLMLSLASCNLAKVNITQLPKSRNSLRIETNRYTPITPVLWRLKKEECLKPAWDIQQNFVPPSFLK